MQLAQFMRWPPKTALDGPSRLFWADRQRSTGCDTTLPRSAAPAHLHASARCRHPSQARTQRATGPRMHAEAWVDKINREGEYCSATPVREHLQYLGRRQDRRGATLPPGRSDPRLRHRRTGLTDKRPHILFESLKVINSP